MNIKDRILIIEDDMSITNFLKALLKASGYHVLTACDGNEAHGIISSQCPDIILLDLGLPDTDGLKILEFIRSDFDIPVIVVSARGNEKDKVEALDLGADDYIEKPFGSFELLARIRTALRHYRNINSMKRTSQELILASGRLRIDYSKHKIFVDGSEKQLTQNEYKIVTALAKFPGKVITYDKLMREVWGPFLDGDNRILRVNMANIRRKLEINPAAPEFIFTEVGVGYRITE